MTKTKLPDDTLYKKEVTSGGKTRYYPYGRILDDNLPYGDWIIRVRKNGKSTRSCQLDPEQYATVEALLQTLEDEIASELSRESRLQPIKGVMSTQDQEILEDAQNRLSDDFMCKFQSKSISDAVHNALKIVRNKYGANNES